MEEIIQRPINDPHDLFELYQITNPLLRERCWEAKLGYGDELILHLGEEIPFVDRKQNIRWHHGSWSLGARGTPWRLQTTQAVQTVVADDQDPAVIREAIGRLKGAVVGGFEILYPDLGCTLTFDTGHQLLIEPTRCEGEDVLAYWYLSTPNKLTLEVGPGMQWSYVK